MKKLLVAGLLAGVVLTGCSGDVKETGANESMVHSSVDVDYASDDETDVSDGNSEVSSYSDENTEMESTDDSNWVTVETSEDTSEVLYTEVESDTEETGQDGESDINVESAFDFDSLYLGIDPEQLPVSLTTTVLDLSDSDMVNYMSGLEDISGVDSICVSEPMMSSIPYSAVFVECYDEDLKYDIREKMMDNIDTAKWICVGAESKFSAIMDNGVFFCMSFSDTCDLLSDSIENIGGYDIEKE